MMNRFLLTDIRFERGRSGRLLNIFSFLGLTGPFEVVLADENLPLTEEKFAGYIEGWAFKGWAFIPVGIQ